MVLVLEIDVKGPGKSLNVLGYDVGGGHGDADAKTCENWHRFYPYILKITDGRGSAQDPIVTAVRLYI